MRVSLAEPFLVHTHPRTILLIPLGLCRGPWGAQFSKKSGPDFDDRGVVTISGTLDPFWCNFVCRAFFPEPLFRAQN